MAKHFDRKKWEAFKTYRADVLRRLYSPEHLTRMAEAAGVISDFSQLGLRSRERDKRLRSYGLPSSLRDVDLQVAAEILDGRYGGLGNNIAEYHIMSVDPASNISGISLRLESKIEPAPESTPEGYLKAYELRLASS